MIKLEPAQYGKAIEALKGVSINCFFARTVAEQHVDGTIYADCAENPSSFYILHPYGMSLLLGNSSNPQFNSWFTRYALNADGERKAPEWMQAYPASWYGTLNQLLGDNLVKFNPAKPSPDHLVEENSRVNFTFNEDKYRAIRQTLAAGNDDIVRTSFAMFREITGSVVPLYFWRNAQQFDSEGVGFSLIHEGKIASTAYASFIHENYLELGIETLPEYRGKGFAIKACVALIDYCIERGLIPVWSCRFENTASYMLAQKLGFDVTATLPYYRLSR